jgi:hypothetical protein
MSVRLYTLYSDIPPASEETTGTPEFAAASARAAARDRVIRTWLQRNAIGSFPKPEDEVTALLPIFTAYSERNPYLNFVFVPERGGAVTISRGVMKCHSGYEAAVRAVYEISEEAPIVVHRNIVFPKYSDGSANPGIPPPGAPSAP